MTAVEIFEQALSARANIDSKAVELGLTEQQTDDLFDAAAFILETLWESNPEIRAEYPSY